MLLRYSIRNILLIIMAAFILSACAAKTTKKIETQTTQITGDTYTGDETVKYLATVFQIECSLRPINRFSQQHQEIH